MLRNSWVTRGFDPAPAFSPQPALPRVWLICIVSHRCGVASFEGEDCTELPGDRGFGPHSNGDEALGKSLPFRGPHGCNQGNAQGLAKYRSRNAVASPIQFPTHSGKPRFFGLPHYQVSSWDKIPPN